jgi:hypothetical protein
VIGDFVMGCCFQNDCHAEPELVQGHGFSGKHQGKGAEKDGNQFAVTDDTSVSLKNLAGRTPVRQH